MNWLKNIWTALSEPLPRHETTGRPTLVERKPSPASQPQPEETTGNFTVPAQETLALAQKEAHQLNHNFVGAEHLLLGLLAQEQSIAFNVLRKAGLDGEKLRKEVKDYVGTGPGQRLTGYTPYTPRVKKVLALAAKEARTLNHTYVGTEHILLGLLREADNVAARILQNHDLNLEQTRREVLKELDPNSSGSESLAASTSDPQTIPVAAPDTPATANVPEREPIEAIDLSKRYDVYCSERFEELVVYRGVLFKGVRKLFREDNDRLTDFIELELADGQTVFVAKYSVVKFCNAGGTPNAGSVTGSQP